jgi:hypothetical protein
MEGKRGWYSDYTLAEINNIVTNMLNYISEHTDEHYNCGDIKERNELINIYTDFGFHKDEVESWYEWLDEQLYTKLNKNNS